MASGEKGGRVEEAGEGCARAPKESNGDDDYRNYLQTPSVRKILNLPFKVSLTLRTKGMDHRHTTGCPQPRLRSHCLPSMNSDVSPRP